MPNINAACVYWIVVVDAVVYVTHGDRHVGGDLALDAGVVFVYIVLLEIGVKNLAYFRQSPK